jgi:glycosyltransferase involved in cell wall biosynthesis
MKILQLCHKPPLPATDGGCIAMNNLTQGLIDAGHKVKILTIFTHKHDLNLEQLPAEYIQKTDIEGVHVDTRINLVDAFTAFMTNDSYHVNRFFSPDMDIKIERLLRKQSFDVIHLESLFMTPYIGTIKRHSKAPVILRAHNIEYTIWEKIALGTKNPLKRLYLNFLAKQLKEFELMMFNTVDGIATISESDKIRMLQLGVRKPIRTIPFGIDLQSYYPTEFVAKKTPSLFHLGAMDWEPNIEGLTWFIEKVWPTIHQSFPDLPLHLAGRNMTEYFRGLNVPGVHIWGEVEDGHAFIQSHDIMVVPLLSGGGIRVKIIEGMALGKVIISSTIGAIGIQYKEKENLLIADTANEWINAIDLLINQAGKQEMLAKNARQFAASHFDNRNVTKELIHFYKEAQK